MGWYYKYSIWLFNGSSRLSKKQDTNNKSKETVQYIKIAISSTKDVKRWRCYYDSLWLDTKNKISTTKC